MEWWEQVLRLKTFKFKTQEFDDFFLSASHNSSTWKLITLVSGQNLGEWLKEELQIIWKNSIIVPIITKTNIYSVLCARHCSKHFAYIHLIFTHRRYYYTHFTNKTNTERRQNTLVFYISSYHTGNYN